MAQLPTGLFSHLPGWKKNLYALWLAQLLVMIGTNAYIPFIPLYIRELGITNDIDAQRWAGLMYAAPFFISMITIPLWGSLGDRYGKKFAVVRAVAGLTLSLALMGFVQNIWQLFFLRIIQGAVSGFVAASISLISSTAPEHKNASALGFLQSSVYAGGVIGPLFGGLIADFSGMRTVFLCVTVLCAFSIGISVLWVQDSSHSSRHQQQPYKVRDNLRFVLTHPEMRNLMTMMMILQIGINATTPILVYFLEHLEAPKAILATISGAMVAIVGIITTIFTPFWGRRNDKKPYQKTLAIACLFVGIATSLHALVPNFFWLIPLRLIIGVFLGAIIPTLYAAIVKRSPKERRGGVVGLGTSATLLGSLISPLFSGWLASSIGLRWAFALSGAVFMIVCPVLWIQYTTLKRQTPKEPNI